MKQTLLIFFLCLCVNLLNAQITVMEENVQERIIAKPQAFDSLSNLSYHDEPIQYKKYIGYKLFCLPFSNKYSNVPSNILWNSWDKFKCKEPKKCTILIKSKGSTGLGFNSKATKTHTVKQTVTTDIYKPTVDGYSVPNETNMYTPYDSVQNTYFTILNIEGERDLREFVSLDEFGGKRDRPGKLRFTLRNETTGEELYWIRQNTMEEHQYLSNIMFLVPYFEKMQKKYKGKNVVSTTSLNQLVNINTGVAVDIQPSEVWFCYDVTFVNLKNKMFIEPFCLLEKDGNKVMVPFYLFTKKCYGIFSKEDHIERPTFMLEQDFNEIVEERKQAAEERQRKEEEKKQAEELARQERNKQIMQKYGNKYGSLICEGKVCLNMTKEMCEESWGIPLSINSTIVSGKTLEQWVYGWQTYLYFDNGILKAIQN